MGGDTLNSSGYHSYRSNAEVNNPKLSSANLPNPKTMPPADGDPSYSDTAPPRPLSALQPLNFSNPLHCEGRIPSPSHGAMDTSPYQEPKSLLHRQSAHPLHLHQRGTPSYGDYDNDADLALGHPSLHHPLRRLSRESCSSTGSR
jgi:hypothetical protein